MAKKWVCGRALRGRALRKHAGGNVWPRSGLPLQRRLPAVGSVPCMARQKQTIAVGREKLSKARAMLGVLSASAAIDVALTERIYCHRLRAGLMAYAKTVANR